MLAGHDFTSQGGGLGVEAELDHPISRSLRLGGRVGYESSNGHALFTFGGRVHYEDTLYFGLDGYYSNNNFVDGPMGPIPADGYGVMIGGGIEGKAGAAIAASEAVIGGFLFLLLLASLSHET